MYQIERIYRSEIDIQLEQLGTKPKFWFRDDAGRLMLFKAEERGTGDDWAEKISCDLAGLLGLPHVEYELARDVERDVPGVICETCAPEPLEIVLGNQVMLALDPKYPGDERNKFKVHEHTVDAVAQAVRLLDPPSAVWTADTPEGVSSALDYYVGYIILDAWIANQDRHHENWAMVWDGGEYIQLAPSFDHGASLARNITDEERKVRMGTRDARRQIPAFSARARSAFYASVEDDKAMKTFDAWRAFAAYAPGAAKIWLERLRGIDLSDVEAIIARIPPQRMSGVCRTFTFELLKVNRERLLREILL